jgi:hypothetical protein
MPMTLSGDGTITGLAAGGLPDASITAAELSGAQSGSAPIYGARAWVNFNGTGTVAIRASGNVSSITDDGTGLYIVNFTVAMADANYAVSISSNNSVDVPANNNSTMTTTSFRFAHLEGLGVLTDTSQLQLAFFR